MWIRKKEVPGGGFRPGLQRGSQLKGTGFLPVRTGNISRNISRLCLKFFVCKKNIPEKILQQSGNFFLHAGAQKDVPAGSGVHCPALKYRPENPAPYDPQKRTSASLTDHVTLGETQVRYLRPDTINPAYLAIGNTVPGVVRGRMQGCVLCRQGNGIIVSAGHKRPRNRKADHKQYKPGKRCL